MTTSTSLADRIATGSQHQAAEAYAEHLHFRDGMFYAARDVDWPTVNGLISLRWGFKGLKRVKKLAWEAAAQREGVAP